MKENKNVLIDKIIVDMKIADDKKALLFILNDSKEVVVKTYGDCCSSSWIENINLPAMGLPAKVLSVGNLDLNNRNFEDPRGNLIQVYGCKITTDKGDIIIEYRNESNGYYGGNLAWPGEYFYGGVHKQNISSYNWIDIKE